jgi:hypothetical protein
MNTIKFNAIDIEAKTVYCYFRNVEIEGPRATPVERSFPFDAFMEREPRLLALLEGDVYSLYIEDAYTEKKVLDGTFGPMNEEEIEYCKNIVYKACRDLEYEDLLAPPSVDDQIDSFIKEFFDEDDNPAEQKDFLADFFKELEEDK